MNAREAVPIQNMLEEMGHKQPPTPLIIDNAVAEGVINKTVKQQQTKAMDMRFHWLQDRAAQKQFDVRWEEGERNKADPHTKRHPAKHHVEVEVRPTHALDKPTSS